MDDYKITTEEREKVKDIASDMLVSDKCMVFGTNYDDYAPFLYEFSSIFHELTQEGKRYLHDHLNKYLWEMGFETPIGDYIYFGGRFFIPPDVPSDFEEEKKFAFRRAAEVLDRIDTAAEITSSDKAEAMCDAALLGWQMMGKFSSALDVLYADSHDEPLHDGGYYTYLPNGDILRLFYCIRTLLPREDQDPEAYLTDEEVIERRQRLYEKQNA